MNPVQAIVALQRLVLKHHVSGFGASPKFVTQFDEVGTEIPVGGPQQPYAELRLAQGSMSNTDGAKTHYELKAPTWSASVDVVEPTPSKVGTGAAIENFNNDTIKFLQAHA